MFHSLVQDHHALVELSSCLWICGPFYWNWKQMPDHQKESVEFDSVCEFCEHLVNYDADVLLKTSSIHHGGHDKLEIEQFLSFCSQQLCIYCHRPVHVLDKKHHHEHLIEAG